MTETNFEILGGKPKRQGLQSSDEKGGPKKRTEDISIYEISETSTATSSKNEQRICRNKTELEETECEKPKQTNVTKRKCSTTLTPFTQTYVQTLQKHSISVPTFSISWSYYGWLHVSTETDTLRPSGITKCKQISFTSKLCHWIEIAVSRSLV